MSISVRVNSIRFTLFSLRRKSALQSEVSLKNYSHQDTHSGFKQDGQRFSGYKNRKKPLSFRTEILLTGLCFYPDNLCLSLLISFLAPLPSRWFCRAL